MESYDCEHHCCDQRFNESHAHLIEPGDCVKCNLERYGQTFVYTDDPNDPCPYCIRWFDVSDRDDDVEQHEPHWPNGEIVPRIYNGICDKCQEAFDDKEISDAAEERLARGDHPPTPGHQGR